MLRLALKLLLAGAAVAAIWAFVPFGGRTLGDRWKASRGPADFVERTWADMKGTPAQPAQPAPPRTRQPARPPRSQARSVQPGRERAPAQPSESHADADRRAIDQLVADRL